MQAAPNWPLVVQVVLGHGMMVAKVILLHFGAFVPGSVNRWGKTSTVTLFHYNHASALHFLLISPIPRSGGMPNVVINGEENVVENGVDGKGEGRVQYVV